MLVFAWGPAPSKKPGPGFGDVPVKERPAEKENPSEEGARSDFRNALFFFLKTATLYAYSLN